MSGAAAGTVLPWTDAVRAAMLFATDPFGLHGVCLRAQAGPVRDQWLTLFRGCLPTAMPVRRLPIHSTEERLLGGLDLAATLAAGRPVAARGVLAETDGGILLLAMAERLPASTAAHLGAVLDTGQVVLERDGLTLRTPARCGIVVLDEGLAEDECPPAALLDRLAFHVQLDDIGVRATALPDDCAGQVAAARERLLAVTSDDRILVALCEAASGLGITSVRAPLLALRAARASAALDGRDAVIDADAAAAGRLVLASRATALPDAEPDGVPEPHEPDPQPPGDMQSNDDDEPGGDAPLSDLVVAAARAAMPAGLLAQLQLIGQGRARKMSSGKAGLRHGSAQRGRPIGVRKATARSGVRLNVVETLRAAAPWQRLRTGGDPGVKVRRDDFRVTRFKQRSETTTIFVVDGSGSTALQRLAEAKGAVELLLADCYVRRDRVALIVFRGAGADLLLPPTRSLVRAKRCLASLPGGGGTPLAAGIDAAAVLADAVLRKGQTPIVILLTDGRANIARDGGAGRARAGEEALEAAQSLRVAGITSLVVDTSPRPQPSAERLAAAMRARYLPLPHADAAALSEAVRATAAASPANDVAA